MLSPFIHSYRTISNRSTFEKGILNTVDEEPQGSIVHPDYKEHIPAALIRRMSKIIRMGVGLGITVKEDKEIGGIIVGTGLGCLENTEKFMDQFVKKKDGILAPTAFIQSTHNTIAGQIGLILKDNCYNSTYTQGGLSFENALLDAMMLADETNEDIIVGGLDEKIPLMMELGEKVGTNLERLGEGGTFFRISNKQDGAGAMIGWCANIPLDGCTMEEVVSEQLNKWGAEDPDLFLYGNSHLVGKETPENLFGKKVICYSDISGVYMTNSAFGVQLGQELFRSKAHKDVYNILLINNSANKDLGLIYLNKYSS